jgi:hypothetical protein
MSDAALLRHASNAVKLPENHISEALKWIIAVLPPECDHDRNGLARKKTPHKRN